MRRRFLLFCIPAIIALLSWSGALGRARSSVSDLLFTPRAVLDVVTIIAIDEESIQSIGQWPWPRAVMAQGVKSLPNAYAIGIDVNFKEPSRVGVGDDQALARAMRDSTAPVVIASEMQDNGSIIEPIAILASSSYQGIANIIIDSDGIARVVRLRRSTMLSFGAQLVHSVTKQPIVTTEPQRINYVGSSGSTPTYSFLDLINGKVPSSAIAGHIVIIGATARDLQDYQNTPFGLMSGVEIQATIINNILSDDFIRTRPWVDVVLTLGVGVLALLVGFYYRRVWVIVLLLAALIVCVWVIVFLTFASGLLVDLVMPTIAVLACGAAAVLDRYTATSRERHFIHDTFSRYLAPQVVAQLLLDPSRVRLGGQKRDITILFSDIRGFTTLSETMGAQELGMFLNRYLSAMTEHVLERQGVIDKYIGDAIMAFWGAPLDDTQHALHGVQSALAMVEALEQFNTESTSHGEPAIAVGIGLNAGIVTVGNMGSEKRFDYTVIGDEVNLSSRLEGLTKMYGVGIIVSANVLERISSEDRREHSIETREIDRVKVKGKTQPVVIYQVLSPSEAKRVLPHIEFFAQGLAHYYAGRWDEALTSLGRFVELAGTDGPSNLLRERCQEFLTTQPKEWNGAYEMTHK